MGVDLHATDPVDGAQLLVGDVRKGETIEAIIERNGGQPYNAVVSDISPRLTGRYDTDQAISLELSAVALEISVKILKPGGSFVTKAFQGTGIELLVEACKKRFSFVRRFSPVASRNSSSEVYLVCKNMVPLGKRLKGSPSLEIANGLRKLGILPDGDDEDVSPAVGFRRI